MPARKTYEELVGKKFGKLTVKSIYPERIDHKAVAKCVCQCSDDKTTECDVQVFDLLYGRRLSCGTCGYRNELAAASRYRDLTGQKFGFLEVVRDTGKRYANNVIWECICHNENCGRTCEIRSCALLTGNTKTCGHCGYQQQRASEVKTIYHTDDEHRLERVYNEMVQRCHNPNDPNYHNYGGRGIRVCDEWRNDKLAFIRWALSHGYKKGLQIDRYPNNDGNYEPSNCRWATPEQNANNKRTDRRFVVCDVDETCARWDRYLGLRKGYTNAFYHAHGREATEKMLETHLKEKRGAL